MASILNSVSGISNQLITQLADNWVKDPLATDDKIMNYVLSQVGTPARTPIDYYQKCTDGIWIWMQKCSKRDKVRRDLIAEVKTFYDEKYYPLRKTTMDGINARLKENAPYTKEDFVRGKNLIIQAISEQEKKIANLKIGEIVSKIAIGSIPVIGQFASLGLNAMDRVVSKADSNNFNYTFNRFMPDPPSVADSGGLNTNEHQWDHVRTISIYAAIGEEYAESYYTVFPAERPKDTLKEGANFAKSNPVLLIGGAGVALLLAAAYRFRT